MKSALSIFFIALLYASGGARVLNLELSMDENRERIAAPDWIAGRLLDQAFYQSWDAYYSDRFTLRPVLIFLKNWLDVRLYKTSPSRKVHLGKDGWIYYRPSLNEYRRDPGMRRAQVDRLFLELHALDAMCRAAGKRFVFTVAPNKCRIYPEYVGYSFRDADPASGTYDLLLEKLARNPLETFVRMDTMLLEMKPSGLVYDRTDTHWNYVGAAAVSERLLSAIYPGPSKPPLPAYMLGKTNLVRDLTGSLMGLRIEEEVVVLRSCTYPYAIRERIVGGDNSREAFLRYDVPESIDLARCLAYRDSFADSLTPFLKGAFRALDMLNWGRGIPAENGPERVADYDVIVAEIVERNLRDVAIRLGPFMEGIQSNAPSLIRSGVAWESLETGSGTMHKLEDDRVRVTPGPDGLAVKVPVSRGSEPGIFRILRIDRDKAGIEDLTAWVSWRDESGDLRSAISTLIGEATAVCIPLPFAEHVDLKIASDSSVKKETWRSIELVEIPVLP